MVLEAATTLGGVWATDRLYPYLKTNNLLGTYEYPDFPMDTETYGVKPGEHIPGHVVHRYLAMYAEKFGIADKILLGHRVVSAEHQPGGGWMLTVKVAGVGSIPGEPGGEETMILARKLVVATGLTSDAFLKHCSTDRSSMLRICSDMWMEDTNRSLLWAAASLRGTWYTRSARRGFMLTGLYGVRVA
jgi:hypothetical protein